MDDVSRELLTLNPSQAQRQELVDNILAVYDRKSEEDRVKGMGWYDTAHDLAGIVGFGDYAKGAGLIAVMSANTGWTQNKGLALAISEGKEVRHLSAVMDKVKALMGGEYPPAVIGKGLKTLNFYFNIKEPGHSGPVTIDRHAHDVARGEVWGSTNRGLTTGTRYAILKRAYQDASALRSIRPHEMQAVTWTTWRREIQGTSTRGKRWVSED